MRKILFCLYLLAGICCVSNAQHVPDTVKIRLETNNGAEIGIDDDISSTNILVKRVAVGEHTVKIFYGTDCIKEEKINVTAEETFKFLVGGTLHITSTPNAEVYVDGVHLGKSPASVETLGSRSVRIEGDNIVYFPTKDVVTVPPFGNVTRDYILKKRPPRLYGMVMGTVSTHGYGVFLGMCRRWGGYIHIASNFKFDGGFDTEFLKFHDSPDGPGYYPYKGENMYGCFSGGVMYRCSKNLYVYGGVGYADYGQQYKKNEDDFFEETIWPYGALGCAAELGVIFKWKALLLSCGYKTIIGESLGYKHNEFSIGVGITIHKQKKDKI